MRNFFDFGSKTTAGRGLISAGLFTLAVLGFTGAIEAHDPETFLKGDGRINKGFTNKGDVEAKRSPNTGRGMPSILGPFKETTGLKFLGQLTNEELGVTRLAGTGAPFLSDIWGWTDTENSDCLGDEFALVGSSSGVAIARITDASLAPNVPDGPVFFGLIPTANPNTLLNFWWDIKVWDNKMYWTTEVLDQGLGVFDLTQLCADGPSGDGILAADAYVDITQGDPGNSYRSAHNITMNVDGLGNAANSIAYITGVRDIDRDPSRDPMWLVDLANIDIPGGNDPIDALASVAQIQVPGEPGPTSIDSHDAQVVTYQGPDSRYNGDGDPTSASEIAVVSAGFNEQLVVFDVSNSGSPMQIGIIDYAGASFSHQGWFDESHTYFFLGDEEDELFGISDPQNEDLPDTTRTYIFDFSDLEYPTFLCYFDAPYAAIDHNMFVKGNKLYQANYTSGFTVWQMPDNLDDLDPEHPNGTCGMVEIAHMDTEPRLPNIHMNHNLNIFVGPWGIFPYFDSGKIIVSDGLNGLIISELDLGE